MVNSTHKAHWPYIIVAGITELIRLIYIKKNKVNDGNHYIIQPSQQYQKL